MLKTLGAVYIVRFNNKENINIDNKIKLCILEESKIYSFLAVKRE